MLRLGYGVRSPTDCWLSAWIVALQSIWAAILNAITLGIVFARISQPKQRARTIFISDSACVARRDGMLKFMFRVADIRKTQVSYDLLLLFMPKHLACAAFTYGRRTQRFGYIITCCPVKLSTSGSSCRSAALAAV